MRWKSVLRGKAISRLQSSIIRGQLNPHDDEYAAVNREKEFLIRRIRIPRIFVEAFK
jgi:hypothetical protein